MFGNRRIALYRVECLVSFKGDAKEIRFTLEEDYSTKITADKAAIEIALSIREIIGKDKNVTIGDKIIINGKEINSVRVKSFCYNI